jgi:uncharacterized membrane protein
MSLRRKPNPVMPSLRPVELHPIIVHFPIALLLLAVALDFLTVFFRRWGLADTASWLLVFGVPSAALALLSGWFSEHYVTVGAAGQILHLHKLAAFSASGLFGFLLVIRLVWLAPRIFAAVGALFPATRSMLAAAGGALEAALPRLYEAKIPRVVVALYLFLSVVAVGLLGLTGYLGGALVYDHGVGAGLIPMIAGAS